MTTTLLSLRSKLQTAIGDENQVYADNYSDAITNAIKQIYPDLFRYLDNRDLVTGNILPPFNWSTTALLDIYTEGAGTTLKNTDGDYIWRGLSSLKATASGADDYWYISSNDYPRLLDLMDKTIDFKCWVYPEVTDDAFLTIYTVKADGTAQTLNSTTSCPAGKHTLLELEDQSINDDIVEIQFRLRVHSTTKYVYFDQPRVTGRDIHEYLLPTDAKKGVISRVYIQPSGYSDDICDDLHPKFPDSSEVFNSKVFSDGTYKYLYLPTSTSKRQIKLEGYHPLETLSVDTDTITPDGKEIELLIDYAAHLMFEMECGSIAGDIAVKTADITAVDGEIATEDTAITAIATDIATETTSIGTVDTEIATEDTAITAIQTSIDTVISNIATDVTALDAITTDIATKTTAVDAVATDIDSVITNINTELATVSNVASEDISRYDAKIARLDSKKVRLEQKREELKAQRENLKIKRVAKDEEIRREDDSKKRLEDKRDALQNKRKRLLEERDGLDLDIKRLVDKRDALQDKRTRLIEEKTALDSDIRRLDNNKARMKNESYEWLAKYRMLSPTLKMITPKMSMNLRT